VKSKAVHVVLQKTSEDAFSLVEGKSFPNAKDASVMARSLAEANQGQKYCVANIWPAVSCEPVTTVKYVTDNSGIFGASKKANGTKGKPGRKRKTTPVTPDASLPGSQDVSSGNVDVVVTIPPAASAGNADAVVTTPAAAAPAAPAPAAVDPVAATPVANDGSKELFDSGKAGSDAKPDDGGQELF